MSFAGAQMASLPQAARTFVAFLKPAAAISDFEEAGCFDAVATVEKIVGVVVIQKKIVGVVDHQSIDALLAGFDLRLAAGYVVAFRSLCPHVGLQQVAFFSYHRPGFSVSIRRCWYHCDPVPRHDCPVSFDDARRSGGDHHGRDEPVAGCENGY